jgi:hypothetical protein
MTRSSLELADIVRAHGPAYRENHPLSPQQAKVLNRIATCRTAALGGHVERCAGCDFTRIAYNSCRDRHCPKCQAARQHAWVESRCERLLSVPYFHVVFTLPHQLNPLALQNPTAIYDLLFDAASATLRTLAADPRRLGAQIGVTAVLHTWGQNLLLHPHLHCVVTGGGLSPDGQRWVPGRERYFLPVAVMAKLFRGKFLAGLKKLHAAGTLKLAGTIVDLKDDGCFRRWLHDRYAAKWVVYAKAPFGGPEAVFRYLGRYTHRVAITNNRLRFMDDGHVTFTWKDYADGHRLKTMRLTAEEFLRRFLLHVLPRGFVRIRHYGLMAGGPAAAEKFARCRELLQALRHAAPAAPEPPPWLERLRAKLADPPRCPRCQGELHRFPWDGQPIDAARGDRTCADTVRPPMLDIRESEMVPLPLTSCDSS